MMDAAESAGCFPTRGHGPDWQRRRLLRHAVGVSVSLLGLRLLGATVAAAQPSGPEELYRRLMSSPFEQSDPSSPEAFRGRSQWEPGARR